MLQWIGQPPTTNWTGVPEPPFWAFTGLPWPPNGQLPAQAPPGWALLANVPKPADYTGVWPPPWPPTRDMVPGWPAEWPFPLPAPPPATQQPPLPPAQKAKAPSKSSAGPLIAAGIGAALLLLLIASSTALEENPCPVCGAT